MAATRVAPKKRKRDEGKSTESAKDAKQEQLASILRLPAELRNRIWEESLVESSRILVTATTKPPSLLQTSRQIRFETFKIWLCQNRFLIDIRDCDGQLNLAWVNTFSDYCFAGPVRFQDTYQVSYIGGPNWANVMIHMKSIFEKRVAMLRPLDFADPCPVLVKVFEAAGNIVSAGMRQERSWENVKADLENLHWVMVSVDSRWA